MKAAVAAPNDIAELEPEFKIMLQATNRSPRTIEAYMAGVEALRAFLVERGMPTAVDAVAREHVEAAYATWIEGGYAAASVIYPGGGSGKRVTVRRTCENNLMAGWSTTVSVSIGNGDSIATPGVNLACQVLTF